MSEVPGCTVYYRRHKGNRRAAKTLSPKSVGVTPRSITNLKLMIEQIWTRQLFKVPPGQKANVVIRLLRDEGLITGIILCSEHNPISTIYPFIYLTD